MSFGLDDDILDDEATMMLWYDEGCDGDYTHVHIRLVHGVRLELFADGSYYVERACMPLARSDLDVYWTSR